LWPARAYFAASNPWDSSPNSRERVGRGATREVSLDCQRQADAFDVARPSIPGRTHRVRLLAKSVSKVRFELRHESRPPVCGAVEASNAWYWLCAKMQMSWWHCREVSVLDAPSIGNPLGEPCLHFRSTFWPMCVDERRERSQHNRRPYRARRNPASEFGKGFSTLPGAIEKNYPLNCPLRPRSLKLTF
jgi:hypothetical protein